MSVAITAISKGLKRVIEIGHVADERAAIGAEWLLETQVTGLAAKIAGLNEIEGSGIATVVVCAGFDPIDGINDEVALDHPWKINRDRRSRRRHDRRKL